MGKNINGGSASGSKSLAQTGYIHAKRINTLIVGGSIFAGINLTNGSFSDNGAIRVEQDIANMKVNGSISGNESNSVVISAVGQANPETSDIAIGTLAVLGSVNRTNILAGVAPDGKTRNADASINAVIVGGDWTASNLIAGAVAGADGKFGTTGDFALHEV